MHLLKNKLEVNEEINILPELIENEIKCLEDLRYAIGGKIDIISM